MLEPVRWDLLPVSCKIACRKKLLFNLKEMNGVQGFVQASQVLPFENDKKKTFVPLCPLTFAHVVMPSSGSGSYLPPAQSQSLSQSQYNYPFRDQVVTAHS